MEMTPRLHLRAQTLGACGELPGVGESLMQVSFTDAAWADSVALFTPSELKGTCLGLATTPFTGRLPLYYLVLYGYGYGYGYGSGCGLNITITGESK